MSLHSVEKNRQERRAYNSGRIEINGTAFIPGSDIPSTYILYVPIWIFWIFRIASHTSMFHTFRCRFAAKAGYEIFFLYLDFFQQANGLNVVRVASTKNNSLLNFFQCLFTTLVQCPLSCVLWQNETFS